MTDAPSPDGVPHEVPDAGAAPSPEDLARMWAAGLPDAGLAPSRWSMRKKLIGAVMIAGIGVGASVMSCVGQSFSLRQARALEGIEQQLQKLQAICPTVDKAVDKAADKEQQP